MLCVYQLNTIVMLNNANQKLMKTPIKNLVKKPVILLPADVKQLGLHAFHAAGHKYIAAVKDAAGGLPLLMPAIEADIDSLIDIADGILLTGSVSNVHPSHFNESVLDETLPLDPARDALTLKLIKAAVKAQVPILAICRGFQEMNVAFGGSLYQAVQQVPAMMDHREDKNANLSAQYGPAHTINLVPGGMLNKITQLTEITVNSLHGQGVSLLGAGLVADAYAKDGLIEAIYVENAATFALGVQWHPEWLVLENPAYLAIFKAFGAACSARMHARDSVNQRIEAPPD